MHLAGYHVGEAPDDRTIKVCQQHGLDHVSAHRGQQLTSAHFSTFDYIFVMDESNLREAKRIQPRGTCRAKLMLLGEFGPKGGKKIVDDPYYGGIDGFEKMFVQLSGHVDAFLDSLNK